MSFIHAQFLTGFMFGDDVVILAMDTAGATVVHDAVSDALRHGRSQLEHAGVVHEFLIQPGSADIELGDRRVEWRLDRATAVDILENIAAPADHAGHHYVDIHTPAKTLVLSYDEYTPEYFEQLVDE